MSAPAAGRRWRGAPARAFLSGLLDLLLPPTCAGCGMATGSRAPLCRACDARLQRAHGGCGLPPARLPGSLAACVAALDLTEEARRWIHRFKYPAPGIAGLEPGPRAVLQGLVVEAALWAQGPAPDLVVPVPLHPRRLRRRGFNPAAVLARALSRRRGIGFDAVALARVRDTPSQTGLDRRARRANVRGAFRARAELGWARQVWLVDDVVTTGSTLGAAALALRRAGVQRVVGVCAARTPESD